MIKFIPHTLLLCIFIFFMLAFFGGLDPDVAFYRAVIVFFAMVFLMYVYKYVLLRVIHPEQEDLSMNFDQIKVIEPNQPKADLEEGESYEKEGDVSNSSDENNVDNSNAEASENDEKNPKPDSNQN